MVKKSISLHGNNNTSTGVGLAIPPRYRAVVAGADSTRHLTHTGYRLWGGLPRHDRTGCLLALI